MGAGDIQNDTARPNIDSAAIVTFASDDFGRAVGGGAADSFEQLAWYHVIAEAEICELHVEFIVQPGTEC